jgi:hypothetical protein
VLEDRSELGEEAALADPRLTAQIQHTAPAAERGLDDLTPRRQLELAADEASLDDSSPRTQPGEARTPSAAKAVTGRALPFSSSAFGSPHSKSGATNR